MVVYLTLETIRRDEICWRGFGLNENDLSKVAGCATEGSGEMNKKGNNEVQKKRREKKRRGKKRLGRERKRERWIDRESEKVRKRERERGDNDSIGLNSIQFNCKSD